MVNSQCSRQGYPLWGEPRSDKKSITLKSKHRKNTEQALKKAIAAGCLSSKGISLNKIKNYKINLNQFSKKINVIKKL